MPSIFGYVMFLFTLSALVYLTFVIQIFFRFQNTLLYSLRSSRCSNYADLFVLQSDSSTFYTGIGFGLVLKNTFVKYCRQFVPNISYSCLKAGDGGAGVGLGLLSGPLGRACCGYARGRF